jgi:hypothetical protein
MFFLSFLSVSLFLPPLGVFSLAGSFRCLFLLFGLSSRFMLLGFFYVGLLFVSIFFLSEGNLLAGCSLAHCNAAIWVDMLRRRVLLVYAARTVVAP